MKRRKKHSQTAFRQEKKIRNLTTILAIFSDELHRFTLLYEYHTNHTKRNTDDK